MADTPTVDPRYNPAFQRGFGTRSAASEAPASAGSALSGPPLAAASGRAPRVASALQAPERGANFVPPPPGPQPTVPSAAEAPAPAGATADTTVPRMTAARPPWTNPFVAALAVVGVLAIAFGVWLLQFAVRESSSAGAFASQGDYLVLQAALIGSPIAVGTGVLILCAVIVLFAVHWAHHPRRSELD